MKRYDETTFKSPGYFARSLRRSRERPAVVRKGGVMRDRRFDDENPLGPPRGVINGLLLTAVFWLLVLGGYWVEVRWFAR